MKMGFLSSGIFWGIILVLIGLSIILKLAFNINIPVFRLLLAVFLIYWGIKLIMGVSFFKNEDTNVVFSDEKVKYTNDKNEYNTIFGKSTIDLSDISTKNTEINVVFGSSDILIDFNRPLKIKSSAAFSSVSFPDETVISFGERVFKTPPTQDTIDSPEVKINVVFGSAAIKALNNP